MNIAELRDLAYVNGRAGVPLDTWVDEHWGDARVADALYNLSPEERHEVETSWLTGNQEHRLNDLGWVTRWTTAERAYDWFGTETLVEGGETWKGRAVRQVMIAPERLESQEARYASGLHGSFEEDPRETERRWETERMAARAVEAARRAERAAGLARLAEFSDDALSTAWQRIAADLPPANLPDGVTWDDVRTERDRRFLAKVEAERVAAVADGLARVPPHATLVDHRLSRVYYDVHLSTYRSSPTLADYEVTGTGRDGHVGSLDYVLSRIARGDIEVVTDDRVPPKPVLDRIGHDKLREIRRVDAEGTPVWVGRPTFAREPLVLDKEGHVVRRRKVIEAALAAERT